MRKLAFIQKNNQRHWVGDGFPVRSIFSYHQNAEKFSPFLLLDYAGPVEFTPTTDQRGVGQHPHRGFETVTIVYDGEVEHRDSSGAGGKIGPGDVQWMTAASGLIHEEYHGRDFAKKGGLFEMIQLWVNLPKKDKMSDPQYQGILDSTIPAASLPDAAGTVRVIAGNFEGHQGPAKTFTPIELWDVKLKAGGRVTLPAADGFTTGLLVLKGKLKLVDGAQVVGEAELAMMEREGGSFAIEALEDCTVFFLSGEPILEPIVGHGPFVMNSDAEIRQAFVDFQAGRMGKLE